MDRFRYQLSVRDIVTPQLIRHDLPWLAAVTSQKALEESFRGLRLFLVQPADLQCLGG
jgi:hypothetical protein